MKDQFDWDRDLIYNPTIILGVAQGLWERQAFIEPLEHQKKEIIELLQIAKEELEDIIGELNNSKKERVK